MQVKPLTVKTIDSHTWRKILRDNARARLSSKQLDLELLLCEILARPFIVRRLLKRVKHPCYDGNQDYNNFVWDVIDHMSDPDPYWDIFKSNYRR